MTTSEHTVVLGDVRFSRLSDSLVRLEYVPGGQFENRQSVRAMCRPDPTPFASVREENGAHVLSTAEIEIRYTPGEGGFTPATLAVHDARDGQKIWDPATVDRDNLGGVHFSMDYIKPGMTPAGVHPATIEHHFNTANLTLWSFFARLNSGSDKVQDAERYQGKRFDEILAETPFEELPPLLRDLMNERWKYPPGVLSRSGYFVYNDSPMPVLDPETNWVVERGAPEGALDLYVFYYRDDFARALADYRLLFGPTPLMPRYALGLWYSRYPTFNETELRDLVATFEKLDLPLDMLVLDLEWHKRGWYGFDWDTNHIQDPDGFLAFLRERGIHTTFNVHPNMVPVEDSRFREFLDAAGIEYDPSTFSENRNEGPKFGEFDVSIPQHAKAFMDVLHKPVQDQGVDFWWIDGEAPVSAIANLDRQLWTNHIYCQHMRDNYPERRPMIFSRTPGLGAHRYPFHFTADTWSYWETLENQVEQTLRAGHIGQSYITHDIGGHISSFLFIDPELYARWVQFAVLNPIVRLHSSKQGEGIGGERRPWLYGDVVLDCFKAAMRLRMELLPYLYTLVWESHARGLPICRSCCIERPDWEAGYGIWDAYFLGDRVFAAPIVRPGTYREVRLPEGVWYHGVSRKRIESDGASVRIEIGQWHDAPPHYVEAGRMLLKQPYCQKASTLPETLCVEYYTAGGSCEDAFTYYEDDGFSQHHNDGAFATWRLQSKESAGAVEFTLHPAEGDFAGFAPSRALEFSLVGSTLRSAELDGQAVAVEETEKGPRIRLDNLDLRSAHTVRVVME